MAYFIYNLIYLYQYKLIFFKQLEVSLCLIRHIYLTLTVLLPVLLRYWTLRFCRLSLLCVVIMLLTAWSAWSMLPLLLLAHLASLSVFHSIISSLTPLGLFRTI